MGRDSLDVFQFEAKSCKWRLRFVKVLDVRRKWLADFLSWFAPKVGLHVILDSVTYEHVTVSECHFDAGIRFTSCEQGDHRNVTHAEVLDE